MGGDTHRSRTRASGSAQDPGDERKKDVVFELRRLYLPTFAIHGTFLPQTKDND
jgi:hypothetical protein